MQNIRAYMRRTGNMKSARGLSYEGEGPSLMKLSAAINPPLLVQRSVTRGQGVDYQIPVSQRRIQQPRPTHVRGDIKIQVLATARFCKSLQTLATTGLPTLSQVCQPLARSEKQTPFSRYPSNDILITLIAH